MDFMDLLLAEALAAGMARQAAESRQRPPPDNYYVLPPDPQAWRKLYKACKDENMVICIEVTDDSHPGSRRAQSLFMDLAREVSQIPFFQVKIGYGRTYDELRQDLRGVRFTPTFIVVFFDDGDVRTTKVEGEEDIRFAIRTGAIHRVMKEYIDRRMKLKVAERLAEELFKGAMASEVERRRREAQLDYERKLQREKEEMERREFERQRQEKQQQEMEEEKRRKLEAEKREEEELMRRKQVIEDKRSKVEDELLKMDLSSCRIRDIKTKMEEAGISHVGATSREDLLGKLKNKLPRLKLKLETEQQETTNRLSGYTTNHRHSGINERDGLTYGSGSSSNGSGDAADVIRLKRKVELLEKNVDELEERRQRLTSEKDSLERILHDKEDEITQKNKELSELRNNQSRRSSALFGSSFGGSGSSSRVQELEMELLETRLLYSCTLDDIDVLGFIVKGNERGEGTVARVKCSKPGIPDSSRVYAMKVVSGVMDTSTLSTVRNTFKTEYEVLSGLPHHKNIVKLFAFFYDRPKTSVKLAKYCGEGMALCMLMEQLSQNMEDHMAVLRRGNGPMASKTIGWLKDVVEGSHFLFTQNIVHRDMKLDNLLISGDIVKISDFGTAIRLDQTMKLPFSYVMSRGGNEAHLAPEILNLRPGPGRFLDYTKQPVWEIGVLAYELAGHRSPFERTSIDQRSYNISSLPRLISTFAQNSARQQAFPPRFSELVKSVLEFDPADRPSIDELQRQIARL